MNNEQNKAYIALIMAYDFTFEEVDTLIELLQSVEKRMKKTHQRDHHRNGVDNIEVDRPTTAKES